jgi:steroid delta-isomerase-like uncharacterized protein
VIDSLIQAYFSAFNENDLEAQLATLHPEVRHDINQGGFEIGIEAFRAFKTHMDECYREQIVELVIMVNGNRGSAEFIVNGEYVGSDEGLPPATGQRYSIPAAAFFEEKEGRLSRVTSYYNLNEWIRAVS